MKKGPKVNKKNIEYYGLVKKSFLQFKNNLGLVIPTFNALLLAFILIIILLLQIGGFYLLFKGIINLNSPGLMLRFPAALAYITIMLIVDIIIMFIIGSYVKSMQISLFRDVAQNKSIEDLDILKRGKEFFKRYFKINVLLTFLILVPTAFVVGLYFLIFNVIILSRFTIAWHLGVIILALFVIALLVYLIFLSYNLLFIDPIIVNTKLNAIKTIRYTIKYSLNNKKHVFMTWFYIFIVMFILLIVTFILFDAPMSTLEKTDGIIVGLIIFALQGLKILAELIIGIILELFKFNVFFTKKD